MWEATSSSESLIEASDDPAAAVEADDQTESCSDLAEEAALPVKRASSLASLSGREWSDWLEELEENCITISSDIANAWAGFNALCTGPAKIPKN